MGRGKHEENPAFAVEIPDRLPDGFWKTEAKTAAVSLLNANRTKTHLAAFDLTIDDGDHAEPPAQCNLFVSYSSASPYSKYRAHYFVRVDPEGSYLAFGRSWSMADFEYNPAHDQPAFDLRFVALPYPEARKISDVLWWLNRVRSSRRPGAEIKYAVISSSDGLALLQMRSPAGDLITPIFDAVGGAMSERWDQEFGRDTLLRFAFYLIATALPEHLGHAWAQFEPKHEQDPLERADPLPRYDEDERKRLAALARQFLDGFSLGEEHVSFAIVGEAARLAGRFALDTTGPQLNAIKEALPPRGKAKRSPAAIEAERKKLMHANLEETDPVAERARDQRMAELDDEFASLTIDGQYGRGVALNRRFRATIARRRA